MGSLTVSAWHHDYKPRGERRLGARATQVIEVCLECLLVIAITLTIALKF